MPLKEGYSTKFNIFSVQNGTTTESRVKVTDKEQITVPAGTFDCYAIELTGYAGMVKALEHKLWISADENKYLVKYDSGQAIMELKEIGLQTQAAKRIEIGEHNISLQLPSGWYHMVNPPIGMYKLMVQLVGPQMEAWVLLTVAERIPLFDSARAIAEMDIEVLKGFFKNYTVREDSWQDRTINDLDAATFEADYEDENARMVEYRTYMLGESMVYWFVFRIEKDKFEENKGEFGSIVTSFKANAKSPIDLSTPEATIKSFVKAVYVGNLKAAKACVSEDGHDYDEFMEMLATKSNHPFQAMIKAMDASIPVEITSKDITEDRCKIKWYFTLGRVYYFGETKMKKGMHQEFSSYLELVGDKWLIRDI